MVYENFQNFWNIAERFFTWKEWKEGKGISEKEYQVTGTKQLFPIFKKDGRIYCGSYRVINLPTFVNTLQGRNVAMRERAQIFMPGTKFSGESSTGTSFQISTTLQARLCRCFWYDG